jgi:hypothetical protein
MILGWYREKMRGKKKGWEISKSEMLIGVGSLSFEMPHHVWRKNSAWYNVPWRWYAEKILYNGWVGLNGVMDMVNLNRLVVTWHNQP